MLLYGENNFLSLEKFLSKLDILYYYNNIKTEDIFDSIDEISKDNTDTEFTTDELGLDEELSDEFSGDIGNITDTETQEQQTRSTDNLKKDIATTVKVASLINKFENIYYELMIIKSRLEKYVSNQMEFWNEIRKFEFMLTILLNKLNKDNVDEIEKLLDTYKETLYEYLKENVINDNTINK